MIRKLISQPTRSHMSFISDISSSPLPNKHFDQCNRETDLLDKAVQFATAKHSFQRRKNKAQDPYITHPLEVMSMLESSGVTDTATLCGAVVHDTIEDTGTTTQELLDTFGQEICSIVLECSDDKTFNKVERKRLQIEHARHVSDKAKLVKLADKLSNISGLSTDPPANWAPEIITGYVRWSWRVCIHLYGINSCLDERMKAVFTHYGVENVTDEQLNEYYSRISTL
jgi:(p)ppGpp synthase/HD superfamily hydrolase